MGHRRAGLTIIAAACLVASLLVSGNGPAKAASAASSAAGAEPALGAAAARIDRPIFHRHRSQSFYCYPRTYWWFYRPYTTAPAGYARCMPYFHYLGRGERGGRAIK